MIKFLDNIKKGYDADTNEQDSADIVQTVLIIAGFAIVVILVVGWIGTAIINKGADIAECIEGSTTLKPGDTGYKACIEADHATKNGTSFKNDGTYKGRFHNEGN